MIGIIAAQKRPVVVRSVRCSRRASFYIIPATAYWLQLVHAVYCTSHESVADAADVRYKSSVLPFYLLERDRVRERYVLGCQEAVNKRDEQRESQFEGVAKGLDGWFYALISGVERVCTNYRWILCNNIVIPLDYTYITRGFNNEDDGNTDMVSKLPNFNVRMIPRWFCLNNFAEIICRGLPLAIKMITITLSEKSCIVSVFDLTGCHRWRYFCF